MKPSRPLLVAFVTCVGASFAGCGSSGDDAVPEEDPAFTQSYVDDYENDLDEDRAQADEQALVDRLDDLDDVEVLDEPSSSTASTQSLGVGIKGLPSHAAHGPLSIIQDDPHFQDTTAITRSDGATVTGSSVNVAAAHAIGARIVRVSVDWRGTTETKWDYKLAHKPAFTATDPSNYDFSRVDAAIDNARANSMQVLVTLSGHTPFWASEDGQHCLDQYNADQAKPPGVAHTFWSCSWKTDVRKYAQWVTAVARHLESKRIWGWTIWNEPNITAFMSMPRTRSRSTHNG